VQGEPKRLLFADLFSLRGRNAEIGGTDLFY
jgi:hypothetical protein